MALTPARLKRLLKHREQLERTQELSLSEAQRRRSLRQAALDASVASRGSLLETGAPTGPIDATFLIAGEAYLLRLDREITAEMAALRHSETEVEGERLRLMERRRDVKAMEALLDRLLEQERITENRAESKRLDEQGGIRWLRRNAGQPQPTGARS